METLFLEDYSTTPLQKVFFPIYSPYAMRHWKQGDRKIAIIEWVPILGAVVSLIELLSHHIFQTYKKRRFVNALSTLRLGTEVENFEHEYQTFIGRNIEPIEVQEDDTLSPHQRLLQKINDLNDEIKKAEEEIKAPKELETVRDRLQEDNLALFQESHSIFHLNHKQMERVRDAISALYASFQENRMFDEAQIKAIRRNIHFLKAGKADREKINERIKAADQSLKSLSDKAMNLSRIMDVSKLQQDRDERRRESDLKEAADKKENVRSEKEYQQKIQEIKEDNARFQAECQREKIAIREQGIRDRQKIADNAAYELTVKFMESNHAM